MLWEKKIFYTIQFTNFYNCHVPSFSKSARCNFICLQKLSETVKISADGIPDNIELLLESNCGG